MIYITSDHAGFKLKKELTAHLDKTGVEYKDLGPNEYIEKDDYPDYAHSMCKNINPQDKGIIICNNGVGVSIVCNRYNHIRAALSFNKEHAKTSREDDNTNVLALPAGFISTTDAKEIVDTWLNTNFSQKERHINRIEKINIK